MRAWRKAAGKQGICPFCLDCGANGARCRVTLIDGSLRVWTRVARVVCAGVGLSLMNELCHPFGKITVLHSTFIKGVAVDL